MSDHLFSSLSVPWPSCSAAHNIGVTYITCNKSEVASQLSGVVWLIKLALILKEQFEFFLNVVV